MNYCALNIRIRPEHRTMLKAISDISGENQSTIIRRLIEAEADRLARATCDDDLANAWANAWDAAQKAWDAAMDDAEAAAWDQGG